MVMAGPFPAWRARGCVLPRMDAGVLAFLIFESNREQRRESRPAIE
jgi:hypothetical protein